MHLGSKIKECLRSDIIVARAEGEGDKYMLSEGFFTYSCGAYTNFLHEERKMRRLFFARRAYSTHLTRRVEKMFFYDEDGSIIIIALKYKICLVNVI